MRKQNLLLVTVPFSKSLPLFSSRKILAKYSLTTLFYTDSFDHFLKSFKNKDFDLIYLRDPFNFVACEDLEVKINLILQSFPKAVFIDKIQSVDDLYFEDKWIQYQQFTDVMPKTALLIDKKNIEWSKFLIKKRVSSGSKGLIFSEKSLRGESSNYIIQDKIDILQEYRVLSVRGEILPTVVLKKVSIKNGAVTVKVRDFQQINKKLLSFTKMIHKKIKFDLVGYDIAELADNSYVLIEINRSPQFLAYHRETGINVAEKLLLD